MAWVPGRAARRRHEPGLMNKMEREYAALLELRKAAGEIAAYAFEPLKLRLADRTFYEIDFLVQLADGTLEAHEVKGHWEDDARVKYKVAQELHPWLTFRAVRKAKGAWIIEPPE